jgi:hypothetical protein
MIANNRFELVNEAIPWQVHPLVTPAELHLRPTNLGDSLVSPSGQNLGAEEVDRSPLAKRVE